MSHDVTHVHCSRSDPCDVELLGERLRPRRQAGIGAINTRCRWTRHPTRAPPSPTDVCCPPRLAMNPPNRAARADPGKRVVPCLLLIMPAILLGTRLSVTGCRYRCNRLVVAGADYERSAAGGCHFSPEPSRAFNKFKRNARLPGDPSMTKRAWPKWPKSTIGKDRWC